jgi:hypothetical protein
MVRSDGTEVLVHIEVRPSRLDDDRRGFVARFDLARTRAAKRSGVSRELDGQLTEICGDFVDGATRNAVLAVYGRDPVMEPTTTAELLRDIVSALGKPGPAGGAGSTDGAEQAASPQAGKRRGRRPLRPRTPGRSSCPSPAKPLRTRVSRNAQVHPHVT